MARRNAKRRFNVVLDTYNTESWTGRQFDATFQVDLKRIVQNPADLAKQYKVTFSFYMQLGDYRVTGFDAGSFYSINIDMFRHNSVQQYNKPVSYSGALPYLLYQNFIAGPMATPLDNHPFFVDNLTNLTQLKIAVINNVTGAIFNSVNDATINSATNYQVFLHFEQL
jgi:hypothetical protein